MLSTLYYFGVKGKLIWAKKFASSWNWTCYTNTLVFWFQYLSMSIANFVYYGKTLLTKWIVKMMIKVSSWQFSSQPTNLWIILTITNCFKNSNYCRKMNLAFLKITKVSFILRPEKLLSHFSLKDHSKWTPRIIWLDHRMNVGLWNDFP